ncbi:hypothetical protein I7I50_03992 [Histoplasma capsulatum G186AR]|uniref:Uncharacterized protein n=1 Tax=Ajellomyces capsulatus TaxID=5037 RepID=A0A8H7YQ13_AJECA|nr:hypothetical protein I7I52_04900 [Histoplasma capsulatum]QSS75000.1 hypothetical protein I7I50_03992 [Histoplasma capsulatum G186AR]
MGGREDVSHHFHFFLAPTKSMAKTRKQKRKNIKVTTRRHKVPVRRWENRRTDTLLYDSGEEAHSSRNNSKTHKSLGFTSQLPELPRFVPGTASIISLPKQQQGTCTLGKPLRLEQLIVQALMCVLSQGPKIVSTKLQLFPGCCCVGSGMHSLHLWDSYNQFNSTILGWNCCVVGQSFMLPRCPYMAPNVLVPKRSPLEDPWMRQDRLRIESSVSVLPRPLACRWSQLSQCIGR